MCKLFVREIKYNFFKTPYHHDGCKTPFMERRVTIKCLPLFCMMNLEYQHLLPQDFAPGSRVWIYQSSRLFSLSEALETEDLIQSFCAGWQAHGAGVKSYGNLFFGRFLVLMADESATTVSGCSTDSSVRFVKSVGQTFGVDFFNRQHLAFVVKDKIEILPVNQLTYAFENGFLTGETLYFNNLADTKQQLETAWIVPVKDSWLASKATASVQL